MGVDEGDADPVIVEEHAALGPVLVQLLVEQQEEEVSGDRKEKRRRGRGVQYTFRLGLGLILLSEVLSGWGACDGRQFSTVTARTDPGARSSEDDSQLR